MAGPFLGQMLLGMAEKQQANSAQKRAEDRETEMLRYKEDLEFEYKNKFAEAQYQMQERSRQEDMGRTIAENSQIGQQLLNFASKSTDPEERDNFMRLGKLHVSMSTLPSKDIVNFANTIKTSKPTVTDRKMAEELKQEELFTKAWDRVLTDYDPEHLQDPEKRTEIFGLTKGMNKQYIKQFQDLVDKVTPKEQQLPPDIAASQRRYSEAVSHLVQVTKSRMRPNEKIDSLREIQDSMNIDADTVNQYLESVGKKPSLARYEREIKDVPREGTFGSSMDWLFGKQQVEEVKKVVPGREEALRPSEDERIEQIVASNPNLSIEEIATQIEQETKEGKIRQ
jgi:hypothetical protein